MKIKIVLALFFLAMLLSAFTLSAQGLGDVNADMSVNIVDALLVAQYYVGLTPSPFYSQFGDANVNGSVDITDALMIARYFVGLIKCFPIYSYPIDAKLMVINVPVIDANS